MKILITGTSGELGSHLAEHFGLHHSIVGLDAVPGKQTTHIGKITDRKRVFSLSEGADAVFHTASLHAPHVKRFSRSDFIETNIRGTLNLLEAAVKNSIGCFIYSSTTSLYGRAMEREGKAVWVTEELPPIPRDIYDITKITAEHLCRDISLREGLPCLSLRISRFFQEPEEKMAVYRFYRGVDIRDVAAAHELALSSSISGYDVFNISARSPFQQGDLEELYQAAPQVLERYCPGIGRTFRRLGWNLPDCIDRVYVIRKAEEILGYDPKFNFKEFFEKLTESL